MLCLNVGTRVFLSPGVAHNSTYEMEFLEIIVSCLATDKRQEATGRLINSTSNPRAQRARNTDSDRLYPYKVTRFYLILSTTVYQENYRHSLAYIIILHVKPSGYVPVELALHAHNTSHEFLR